MNITELPLSKLPFWPFVVILILVTAILYVRAANSNNWTLVLRSVFSPRAALQLIREENIMENTFSGLMTLTFFFSMALFLYSANTILKVTVLTQSIFTYFIFLLSLFGMYVVKISSLYILQLIFRAREIYEEYLVSFINIMIVLGVCLIPFNLLLIYSAEIDKVFLLLSALILIIISFIIRYIRIFEIGLRNGIKEYVIILYLCTLEIMPLVLLFKFLELIGLDLLTL